MPSRKHLDLSQLAKSIVDQAAGDEPKAEAPAPKNEHAVRAGALGGKKGGISRDAALTQDQKQAIAKKAASARWKKP